MVGQQFGPEKPLTSNLYAAEDMTTGDLDGDGDNDVIVTCYIGLGMVWFENEGGGDFGVHRIIRPEVIDTRVKSIHASDLDSDGDIDILCATDGWIEESIIFWYENLGDGIFSDEQIISDLVDEAQLIYSADLDGDADQDIISVSSDDNKIAWYENLGNGNFGPQLIISLEGEFRPTLLTPDIDGDGYMDLLYTGWSFDSEISWYRNLGNGEFSTEQIITDQGYRSVDIGDLDNDGDLDIVFLNSSDVGQIAWCQNLGNGEFGPEQLILNQSSYNTMEIHLNDIDEDGDLDIFSLVSGGLEINLILNYGEGNFNSAEVIDIGNSTTRNFFFTEIVGSGDILYMQQAGILSDFGTVSWIENEGGGLFGDENEINTYANGTSSLFSADLDNDGDYDVLSASVGDDKFAIYNNIGDGQFDRQYILRENVEAPLSIFIQKYISAADFDQDGDQEVITSSNGKISWYENQGSNIFGNEQIISDDVYSAVGIYPVDFNDDDLVDIFSASSILWSYAWYENLGGGLFGNEQLIEVTAGTNSENLVDLDGDDDMDIIIASTGTNSIGWIENIGNGNFSAEQIISNSIIDPRSINSSDLDNDGDFEVICISTTLSGSKLIYLENFGNGEFGLEQIIGEFTQGNLESFYTTDLDGDGDNDFIIATEFNPTITWIENYGFGLFGNEQEISDAPQATLIHASDLDDDDKLDLLYASFDRQRIGWFENLLGSGCMDPEACNYSEQAEEENGSCCYDNCGCTDPSANNFNSDATCDNLLCEYFITGLVFVDFNEDGIFNGEDYGLPNQQVELIDDGLTAITNDEGNFILPIYAGDYVLKVDSNPNFPFNTSPNQVIVELTNGGPINDVFFGLSEEEALYGICVDLYPPGSGYECDVLSNHNICFRNLGNIPLDGIVEFEFDTLFQGFNEVTPIDSADGNRLWMSYENLLPGQMFFYDLELHTPTVDYIGDFLTSNAQVIGVLDGDTVAGGVKFLEMELTCAYDPNDKQVFPIGYSDEHYIANDTILEYLIRFQNTGNAPATDIHVRDTLDANLDISSFQLVANSHSVFTTIDPNTREIDFFFQDIQLPDSVNNEPESHGLISFRIRPNEGLPLLTELNNYAAIYFDNNPPIITNTTWSTIYNCSLFEVSFTDDFALLTASEGDDYQWFWNDEEIPGATNQEYIAMDNGDYAVEVNSNFPCSGISATTTIILSSVDELKGTTVKLFPNPMTDRAMIDLGELRGVFELEIYDAQGKLVRSKTENSIDGTLLIERVGLATGNYTLRLRTESENISVKFIVE